ncbi:MAG: MBL fold metallo-hydrolase [Immundisolibacteraceae bacterium]|nr:MBL fold metallo-hydrolase [Immundisolibacteraceae bacterium]
MFDDENFNIELKENQIEVVLLSHGTGECILIKYEENHWIILDSFLYNKEPIAKIYLDKLGVDSSCVHFIGVTHWHDDHIKGFRELLKVYKDSEVLISMDNTFEKILIKKYCNEDGEFLSTFKLLESEKKRRKFRIAGERKLLRKTQTLTLKSLTPQDSLISLGIFDKILNKDVKYPSHLNLFSIVLHCKMKNTSILLGADMENHNSEIGWEAIVRDNEDLEKASLFKIPHHGSKTGYNKKIWNKMLTSDAIAILAPYSKCKSSPPQKEDLENIIKHVKKVYIACKTKSLKNITSKTLISDPKMVELFDSLATIKESVEEKMGGIRLSKDATSGSWDVDLLGSAFCYSS